MTAEAVPPTAKDEDLPRMSFGDHLDELRRRLVISIAALFLAVLGFMPFKTEVTSVYVQPYRMMWNRAFIAHCEGMEQKAKDAGGIENLHWVENEALKFLRRVKDEALAGEFPAPGQIEVLGNFRLPYSLKATGGLEDFWIFMAATILFGIIVASPVVLWQAWAFISAGLYAKERAVVMRYFPFAAGLLMVGCGFGYFLALPFGLYFLTQMMVLGQVEAMLTVGQYFAFLLTLTAALGFVFQLPLMMLAIVKVGLVKHETLKKQWRFIILGFFAVSACLTPPDPFTQLLMAGPMIVLYLIGLILTSRAAKSRGPHALEVAN